MIKKILAVAIVLAVVVGTLVALRKRESSSPFQTTASSPTNAEAISRAIVTNAQRPSLAFSNSVTSQNSAAAAVSAIPRAQAAEAPFVIGSADTPPTIDPATVVGNMRIVINNYASMFKENPVGTNPEITAALNGGNPKQVKFINEDSGLRINGRGELVDSWGTPFFFHQLSGKEMEIRSAGPDKRMWTADDLVTR